MTIGCGSPDMASAATGTEAPNSCAYASDEPLQVDLTDPVDLAFWALMFEVSEARVQQAVRHVGIEVGAVAVYLRSNAPRPL